MSRQRVPPSPSLQDSFAKLRPCPSDVSGTSSIAPSSRCATASETLDRISLVHLGCLTSYVFFVIAVNHGSREKTSHLASLFLPFHSPKTSENLRVDVQWARKVCGGLRGEGQFSGAVILHNPHMPHDPMLTHLEDEIQVMVFLQLLQLFSRVAPSLKMTKQGRRNETGATPQIVFFLLVSL